MRDFNADQRRDFVTRWYQCQERYDYEFAHLSFQEYLVAAEVVRTRQEALLYDGFEVDWCKPTILLYAAQVKPTRLLRQMVGQGATDLAYTCWQDTMKRLDPELEEELHGLKQP